MKMLYVYALEMKIHSECFALPEKSDDPKLTFLFECPEQWLPENAEVFRKACEHHKVNIKQPVSWFGQTPY